MDKIDFTALRLAVEWIYRIKVVAIAKHSLNCANSQVNVLQKQPAQDGEEDK